MIPTSVSVVVLNYEYHMFLGECLRSLMSQERRPAEVLVMDDASPDYEAVMAAVRPFVEEGQARGIDVSLHVQGRNLGTPGNMRSGLVLACGDYVMMLGADNHLDPRYISRTARVLDHEPRTGVVYTDAVAFGPLARERSERSTWWRNRRIGGGEWASFVWEFLGFESQTELREALAQRNFIHGSSLFRRAVLRDHTRGSVARAEVRDMARAEDWDLWKQVVIGQGWDAAYVREPLLYYRQHSVEQRNVPKAAGS